jgi:cyclopropane fatty-acyl-phospholipid synthase-like methyltransferase
MSERLRDDRFPRSNAYHPDWIISGVSGAAHPLWLSEWLTEAIPLAPGMRVLDLGCGRGLSSVFLRREFGVEVWSVDLWFDPTETLQRFKDSGLGDGLFPLNLDARSLPFAEEFFDAVISIDSYFYFGTDDLFLGNLARFIKPEGWIGFAGVGLVQELPKGPPESLAAWWTPDLHCLHSADWWARHWTRSGAVAVRTAESWPDGWRYWHRWVEQIAPENRVELDALAEDAGKTMTYVRVVGQRRPQFTPTPPVPRIPSNYQPHPLLRITQ